MVYDLNGKIALITGGASGIGLGCAKELLRNGVQAVTIADVNALRGEKAVKELTKEFGEGRVIYVKIDVNKSNQLAAAFKTTLEFWKGLDIVINNAAISNDNKWELQISLNCKGVVQGTLLGLQYMGRDKGGYGGIIVNISSLLGLGPSPFMPIYAATKHFVTGFTRSIADPYHYNRTGVKILILAPGLTETSFMSDIVRRPLQKLSPHIGQHFFEDISTVSVQPVEHVGRGMVTLLKKGENGSVWVVESNKPICEVQIPHWSTYETL